MELVEGYKRVRRDLVNGYGRGVADTEISCPSASKKHAALLRDCDLHPLQRQLKEQVVLIEALIGRISTLEQSLLPRPMPTGPCETIIQFLCKSEGIKKADLFADRRHPSLTKIRHIGFYLCSRLTQQSLPIIGVAWKRDHTSIMHGRDRIIAWRERDPALDVLLAWYERELMLLLSPLITAATSQTAST